MVATWIERRRRAGTAGRSGRGCGRRWWSGRTRSRPTRTSGSRSRPTTSRSGRCRPTGSRTRGSTASGMCRSRPRGSASGSIIARRRGARVREPVSSPAQDTIVRPNLPDRSESSEIVAGESRGAGRQPDDDRPGRRPRVDLRPLLPDRRHALRRPARRGEWPQSRSHFRAIVGGLAVGRRLDWFTERLCWEAFQHYQGATNLLMTELSWRNGPIRVLATDFVAMGDSLPRTAGGTLSPGQYIKRFRMINEGTEPRRRALRRLHPGRGQRRDRRARPELARRRPDPAGDQPRPRPRQPQAGARLDRRVRHRARRPGRCPLRADRPQRGDLAPLARPAGRVRR